MTLLEDTAQTSKAPEVPGLQQAHAAWLRQRRNEKVLRIALGFGLPIVLIALWELGSRVGVIDPQFFPSPSTVAEQAWSDAFSHHLLQDVGSALAATLVRLAWGFLIGAVAGLVLGLLMGTSRFARFSLAPLISATYPMPKLALLPLLLVLLGIGEASKIALVALGVFFMVALNTLSGVSFSSPLYRDVAHAFAFPRRLYLRYVVIPGAMPSIINGIKLAIGQGLILIVSVEFVSSNDGLGYFIWNAWQILNIPQMFVGLAVVLLLGAAAAWLGTFLERVFVPWARRR
ncbi:MAG: taurine transporter permease [Streptosporangiaceae bacterium]|nr:taurine transporter permease [Streptosporangiaceae bacterium]